MAKIDQKVADTERRVKAKLNRLKNKGIRTGAINPLKNVEGLNAKQKQSYVYNLERFIDQQFIGGSDGTPIRRSVVQQIRYNERAINRQRAERYGYDKTPASEIRTFMGARRLDELQEIQKLNYGRVSTAPIPQRRIETLKSENAALNYLRNLQHIQTPEYSNKKMQVLRDNMEQRARAINSDRLLKILPQLTDQEIEELYSKSDFIEVLFWQSNAQINAHDLAEPIQQVMQFDNQEETLLDLITSLRSEQLRNLIPKK